MRRGQRSPFTSASLSWRGGADTYRWRADTMTSVIVRPSAAARSWAAFQRPSGTRTFRTGVLPVAGLAMAHLPDL
jgi:hypothetical protein